MNKYRNKNNIPYLKFIKFVDDIKGFEDNELYCASKIIEIFETNDFEAFNDAMQLKAPVSLPYDVDMTFSKAWKFIDCENYIKNNEVVNFLKLVLVKKHWWSRKVNINRLSLGQVEYILSLFTTAQPG